MHCLNGGTETPRAQEGRLSKGDDLGTRGSSGHLSPTGKLHPVVLEVPWSPLLSHFGHCKSDASQGSWPSPVNRNWLEARQEIQARLYWGPCRSTAQRGENSRLLCLLVLSEAGQACSLCGVEVCPGVRLEGWLRWFAHPLGGGMCRGPCPSTLLLLPTPCFCSRLFRSDSWVFWSLFFFGPEFAPAAHA